MASDTSVVVATDTTTPDGSYTLNGVADGSYKLLVKHPSSLRRVINVTITGGAVVGGIAISDLLMGDANGDNTINAFDLGILGGAFNQGSDTRPDFNSDATVNAFDLGVMGANYNQSGENP